MCLVAFGTAPRFRLNGRCCRLADMARKARFKRVFALWAAEIILENFYGIFEVVWYIRALSIRRMKSESPVAGVLLAKVKSILL